MPSQPRTPKEEDLLFGVLCRLGILALSLGGCGPKVSTNATWIEREAELGRSRSGERGEGDGGGGDGQGARGGAKPVRVDLATLDAATIDALDEATALGA